ncbi:COG1361 family protein [Couchioplanes caeruleus]|uniref:LPXTG-motif cell wall-anchored protein n=2 Tax=Couchioplanes caeruleus TaxID=56438 RepID=A0A1K0FCE3_9ACTN|nr:hypothetical protein [Couchioplanes caeruleus]OJF10501.1 hypothetical protein BG844_31235 [Couchioplanes caeruleus subsp. caeruleus]ROP28586.1 hypothetical protein EDD30_1350 [Couchioplanes caeruleus]
MHHHSGRRLLAGLAAAGAAVLGLAAPAQAAPGATLGVSLSAVTVGIGARTELRPTLSADREVSLSGATMTYELSGDLAGVSLVQDDDDCAVASPAKLTCTFPIELEVGPDFSLGDLDAGLAAAKTAVAGSTGTLTVTFAAEGVTPVTETAKVTVADSVDLTADGTDREINVKPGATFTAPLAVANTGDKTVRGAGLFFATDYAFQATRKYSNCLYVDDRLRGCLFDQAIEPGDRYGVTLPYRLRKDTYAPSSAGGEFQWMTTEDYRDLIAGLRDVGTAGDGPALTLKPKTALRGTAAAPQTDIDPDDNWQRLIVNATGQQGADIVAVGGRVSGAAGATVEAAVGLRNKGPATLDSSRRGGPTSIAVVTIPAGTEVVTVPAGCHLVDGENWPGAKAGRYYCETGFVFRAGDTVTWKFGLLVKKVVPDAAGTVEANPDCPCERFTKDLNKANDKAALIVNPTGKPAQGKPAQGDDKPAKGGAGGQGGGTGGLPITGPQGAAIAGAGTLLVAAGVAVLMVTRRRTRSES